MRFAAHLSIADPDAPLLAATAGSVDPVAQIDCAARLGFAGITDNGLKARAPEVQQRIGLALRDHGMEMGSFTHDMPGVEPPFFWGAPVSDMEAAMAASLAAAEHVGGGCINAILLDCGAPLAEQLARAVDNLAAAATLAAERGVALAVEMVSRERVPLALMEGVTGVAAIARSAGVGLILDSCHCHCAGDDMAAAILAQADILRAVQIADMPGRVEPGAGVIDFVPIMAALRRIGWGGLVEAELMPREPGVEGEAAAVAALRALG
ncbi:Xylose isomerase domain-containing protein TIM barrel [Sphingobium chlorophenolicum L-1]|uniref:Xylose isomerase domain-containing protein TIM barrel n=1 Tax=Sphingobium chlorophenolicum L-1 TaxID=690566 RepID=F6F0W6_SPHCR|nr:TIM barrel protein [Sphingobium chlorophenolicum]AEG51182.1 Xylose isomerase domain-containing protein TIM barrel [Sphingobium chlorophenolicum L-1]